MSSVALNCWGQARIFLEMIRFSHTVFAMPFAVAGAVLAWRGSHRTGVGQIALDLVGIIVCMILARTTAMAFNRLVDRHLDAANPRTANRHLPTGRLSVRAVSWFALLSGLGFVVSTAHFLIHNANPWPLYLAIPVLAWICAYSLTKRFTAFCHVWLGASLMLAPIAAWIAIYPSAAWPPVWLGLAVLFWVTGFDILYATQDVDFDRQSGLHSVPARFGVAGALRLAALCHLMMLGVLLVLGLAAELGLIYFAGLLLIAALLFYEHLLVRPNDLSRVNQAFFHMNAIISIGLLVLLLADLAWPWRW